jgi:hypothetical protein
MHILGMRYDIKDVNEALADALSEIMKTELEAAKVLKKLVKMPESFKKDTKWRVWKESVIAYLHSKTGQASLPLAYIIRE